MEILQWNVDALEGDLVQERFGQVYVPSALSRAWLARCLADLGRFSAGSAIGDEGLRIAEAADHPFSVVTALYGVGYLYLHQGDFHRAIPPLERSLALCDTWHFGSWYPPIASSLGLSYARSGRLTEGIPVLEQAVQRAASMSLMGRHSVRLAALSEAYLLTGRPDEALDLATQVLDLCRQHKERGNEAQALRLLAEILSDRDPSAFRQAEDHYRQATALAKELGMLPLIAHCHLGLGRLYRRIGQREQGEASLTTATTMYREMDMRFWLEKADAEMAALR
jgi:tetratricopeptide (TPR) repeat protein